MIRCFLLILVAGLLAGCGYDVRYTPLNNPVTATGESIEQGVAARGPINPADVTLFLTARPEQRYRELGIIAIPTYQTIPPEDEIFPLFRQKAAEVGADGVILLPTETAIDSYSVPTFADDWGVFYQETIRSRSVFKGMAIQYLP